jgi:hypothetical protein
MSHYDEPRASADHLEAMLIVTAALFVVAIAASCYYIR